MRYKTTLKIAVLFDMFGPYHLARLNALGEHTPTLGVEVSARSKVYDWNPMQVDTAFERRTLFRASDSSEITTTELAGRIGETLSEWHPDVVFIPGWASRTAFASLRWAQANRIPTVVMSESTRDDATRSPFKELVKRGMVGCFNAGFVGGRRSIGYLRELGMPEEAIFTGYNAVDNEFFAKGAATAREKSSLRESLGLPGRYFLASARFITKKNLMGLLSAFEQFLSRRPETDIDLVLLGDGEERTAIEKHRTELGLENRVLLPGFKQYDELPAYYGLADAFIHVSAVEPWGLVVNEAMSAALPVVVSRVCGCADDLVRTGENGFVVDHENVDQIAEAMCRLEVSSPELLAAMGSRSWEIVQSVSPERFAGGACAAAETALRRSPARSALFRRLLPVVVAERFR